MVASWNTLVLFSFLFFLQNLESGDLLVYFQVILCLGILKLVLNLFYFVFLNNSLKNYVPLTLSTLNRPDLVFYSV